MAELGKIAASYARSGPAIATVVSVALVGTAVGLYFAADLRRLTPQSTAQSCLGRSHLMPSLFGDGQTTAIRVSNADYSQMRVLRTEPANILPGMFGSLLSLSSDDLRLAYVTATDEEMTNAHIESIDVANPSVRVDVANFAQGFWIVKPAWSPDGHKLAYVTLAPSSRSTLDFQLWVADLTTQPPTASIVDDVIADSLVGGQPSSLCWTSNANVVLVTSAPSTYASGAGTSASTGSRPIVRNKAGSKCGVPVISQNDPAWRDSLMQPTADSIGTSGCALTSAAMLLDYYQAGLSPARLMS